MNPILPNADDPRGEQGGLDRPETASAGGNQVVTSVEVAYSKLTPTERRALREQYIVSQNGKCFYCHESLSEKAPKHITDKPINWNLFPPNFLQYPVHLQHNHDTDMTEGAVHNYCNAVMWQYERR